MPEIKIIEIKEEILADNDKLAGEIRRQMQERGILLLNLMSSPGSGKTSLIVRTVREMGNALRTAVIEADIDSTVDAETVAREGVPAVQFRTGGACHLDAAMVEAALREVSLDSLDLVILENIGNLVCPAEFDTGASVNVMILSVPEGDDKPLKYPLMFSTCDALVVNKIDYLQLADFNLQALRERAINLNPRIRIFEVSCKTGEGILAWVAWLRSEIEKIKEGERVRG
ncbi:MAG: hydrogenase nickel incorporation protein HypB [Syntrophales bacterium]|nr:hydrogenase nickel incorporation protein HypB [Syntrophales bacterium]